ncbi:hypothetical protein BV133_648 [Blastochloris viridis]|uniref:Uncharacterized protein n=1 Tax=Blastochloris viridis TaxID=1079 RepID=A0A182D031_BLAVI|nr:hypothetical protein BV133_648 [Blastochloris viridis]
MGRHRAGPGERESTGGCAKQERARQHRPEPSGAMSGSDTTNHHPSSC